MQTRNSDNVAMKPIMDNVTEHKKRQWPHPIILKNQFLLWAHMQRFHSLMSPELKEDLETLLKHSMRIECFSSVSRSSFSSGDIRLWKRCMCAHRRNWFLRMIGWGHCRFLCSVTLSMMGFMATLSELRVC